MKHIYVVLLVIILASMGCQVCKDYEQAVIEYGQMVVNYNKAYISADKGLTEDDKTIMLKACDEYMKLLRKE
jgi:hypothetical protein